MKADQLFKDKIERSSDFKFDANVVNVFDDMVVRSVPFYLEFQRMIGEIALDFAKPDTAVYDLGCSTGTTLISLNTMLDKSVRFVGVDESSEMLKSCRKNFETHKFSRTFDFVEADLNKKVDIHNASVVILCLTMQFVRPINRLRLLQSIHEQLNEKGCIILIEKVLGESRLVYQLLLQHETAKQL
jgi:tRNA (cmo5U34)-methyltransferase